MSVIHFTPDELGPIAAYAVGNTSSSDGQRALGRYCEALAKYSVANAETYRRTYGDKAEAWTAEDIRHFARVRASVDEVRSVISNLRLLRYNLIANDGTDFATVEILDALLSMACAVMRRTSGEYLTRSKAA